MSASSFIISLTILLAIFFLRFKITSILNDEQKKIKIQSEWIVYIVTVLLIVVISLAMLRDTGGSTALSDGFNSVSTHINERPNPMFDINTYW